MTQAGRLAEADSRGAPYVVPMGMDIDYELALAIARSKHPSRVLANTNGYRFGRFTECPPDGRHDGAVNVHMMGSHIAEFTPDGVRLWTCGWPTVSTSEALSDLVTGGYFYTDGGVVKFSRYETTGTSRKGEPITEGALYPYKRIYQDKD
jgi:hypothetical protein